MGVSVRLGAGAGFAGDRIDPALELARHADLDYLVFECLGERTVATGQARRREDPATGFDPMLETRLRAVLPACRASGTTVVTNSGAANPTAAGELALAVGRELGLHGLRIAVVTGDDVLDAVVAEDPEVWETGRPVSADAAPLSANAYLGAEGILEALDADADVVITGRVADPSLFLAPLRHELGWSEDDWEALGTATMVGHLLECAGQLTGGYFADPVTKPVAGMARLGFPFADVDADGGVLLQKLARSGGRLDARTCGEQLLYEVDDPTAYVTPDVVADFSGVRFVEEGPDRVRASGASGDRRPDRLKVTLGRDGGWLGEGQLSYAGRRCLARAEWAGDIVAERLVAVHGLEASSIDVELVGAGAAFRGLTRPATEPAEVRLRVAARVADRAQAAAVAAEVEALYTNGPAGGGGSRGTVQSLVAVQSCLLPRHRATARVDVQEVP